jgi:hypothetical protein
MMAEGTFSLDDQRDGGSREPHAVVIEPDDQSVPVLFDLVDPLGPVGTRFDGVERHGGMNMASFFAATSGERRT